MKETLSPEVYQAYVKILQEELVPAMGCTEPIALAYAAALARRELGCLPQMVTASVSANIIKNVKSVVVPNTGGLRGIQAAVAAGAVAGDADRELEVLAGVSAAAIIGNLFYPFTMGIFAFLAILFRYPRKYS